MALATCWYRDEIITYSISIGQCALLLGSIYLDHHSIFFKQQLEPRTGKNDGVFLMYETLSSIKPDKREETLAKTQDNFGIPFFIETSSNINHCGI